jgi:hypothetical protein
MTRISLLICSLLVLAPGIGRADERVRELKQADLAGIWDGLVVDPMRLFVAEIHDVDSPSYVAMVSVEVTLFKVTRLVLRKDTMDLEAEEVAENPELRLRIRGRGYAVGDEGKLVTQVSLMEMATGRLRKRWPITFVNLKGNFVETLAEMKEKAGKAIVGAKQAKR